MSFVGRNIDPFMRDSSFIIDLFCVCVSLCDCFCMCSCGYIHMCVCLEVRCIL